TTPKPDGSIRLLIDYRKLNLITKDINLNFPTVYDDLHNFKEANFFSTLDMLSGYYHVDIKQEDRFKTAFVTHFGKYEFNRVPFVLKNAPKFFNNMMQSILIKFKNVKVFIDDIILFTKTEEEHVKLIEEVFKVLRKNNIQLNFKKCKFLQKEIKY